MVSAIHEPWRVDTCDCGEPVHMDAPDGPWLDRRGDLHPLNIDCDQVES